MGGSVMTERGPEDFICPQCKSRYKLVRAEPGPRTTSRPVHCKVCRHPFAPREGENVLKYFLIAAWQLQNVWPWVVGIIAQHVRRRGSAFSAHANGERLRTRQN